MPDRRDSRRRDPDRHEPLRRTPSPSRRDPDRSREAAPGETPGATALDPVSLFAVPIGRTTSPPGDPVPVTQTLYRTPDQGYAIRTCLHLGSDPTCDVMIYADEAALREALSAGADGLDRALLAAAGLDRNGV